MKDYGNRIMRDFQVKSSGRQRGRAESDVLRENSSRSFKGIAFEL